MVSASQNKILDMLKFADNKIHVPFKLRVENIEGIRQNAGNQNLLLFP